MKSPGDRLFRDPAQAAAACNAVCASAGLEAAFDERGLRPEWQDPEDDRYDTLSNGQFATLEFARGLFDAHLDPSHIADVFELLAVPSATPGVSGSGYSFSSRQPAATRPSEQRETSARVCIRMVCSLCLDESTPRCCGGAGRRGSDRQSIPTPCERRMKPA